MKKLFIFPLLMAGIVLGSTSCLKVPEDDGSRTFSGPAVVSYKNYQVQLLIGIGGGAEFHAPELALLDDGDCLITSFNFNANDNPPVATDIRYVKVGKSLAPLQDSVVVTNDTLPISGITPYYHPIHAGKIFVELAHTSLNKDATVGYRMTAVRDTVTFGAGTNTFNLYLTAEKQTEGSGTSGIYTLYHVFDVKRIIDQYGKTGVWGSSTIGIKAINVNIYYLISKDATGKPVWKQLNTSGSDEIAIFL